MILIIFKLFFFSFFTELAINYARMIYMIKVKKNAPFVRYIKELEITYYACGGVNRVTRPPLRNQTNLEPDGNLRAMALRLSYRFLIKPLKTFWGLS